ncbi:hypothetical protein SLA2020_169300 [Shorea laevis]
MQNRSSYGSTFNKLSKSYQSKPKYYQTQQSLSRNKFFFTYSSVSSFSPLGEGVDDDGVAVAGTKYGGEVDASVGVVNDDEVASERGVDELPVEGPFSSSLNCTMSFKPRAGGLLDDEATSSG